MVTMAEYKWCNGDDLGTVEDIVGANISATNHEAPHGQWEYSLGQ